MSAEKSRPAGGGSRNSPADTESTGIALSPEETARALDIARDLVKAGAPAFVAPPCPSNCDRKGHTPGTGFHLPSGWETSTPTLDVIDRWRPGWALAVVGGHAADILDVDPRNGGDASADEVRAAGQWPRSFGQQATPSGGTHDLISATGEGKGDFMPGLDLQSGRPDGTGRGFAFISPTVRPSKVDGVPRPYRWIVEPDTATLAEFRGADDSTAGIVARVHAKRTRKATAPAAPAGAAADAPDVIRRVEQLRNELAAAGDGANDLAARLAWNAGQYVGAGQVGAATATRIMLSALGGWTYQHPADEQKMRNTIRSQIEKGAAYPRAWEAPRVAEWQATADTTGQGGLVGQGEQAARKASIRERMRARLYDRDRIDSITPPTPLIDGVLDVATIAFLSGKFGTYKTFVSVAWACSVATGTPWEGREVVTPGPVLYVAAEGCSGLRARVRSWEVGNLDGKRIPADRLAVYDGRVKITDQEEREILGEFIQEIRPVLVVLDTLHKCAPGMEENSSKDMGMVLDAVADLRERYGVTVLLNHHTGHNGERSRGSSSLEDDADTSWVVRLADQEDRSASNQRTLVHRKAKDRELLEEVPLTLELVSETGSAYVRQGTVASPKFLPDGLVAGTLIKMLDDLEVPQSAGRPTCQKALAGKVKASTEVWAEAMRRRQARETGQGGSA
ncbi:AAA family ATPase [Micromonospora arborensis]|uniref:AAA family ATPase n=1 Tax=Micromonospora arborensis TaxID=2116518 RepID=UPI00371B10D7